MKLHFPLFTLLCLSLSLASTALARPELFLLDDARLNEIRSLITVPDTTHYEAYNALSARVAANDIAGTTSYERGYMAREASFQYLITGDLNLVQIAYDRLQEIYSISVPAFDAAPDEGTGLGRAQTMLSFAMTYNWAYDGLTPGQRDWIADKVNDGLNEYVAEALSHPNIGFQANNSNWNGVVAGAHVMTLLAMGYERERRFDFQRSREYLRTHLSSLGDRGWTQEGNFYFGLSMEHVFPAMMALRQINDPHLESAFASRRPHNILMYAGLFNADQNSLTWGVGGDTLPAVGMTSGLLALVPEGERGFYRWVYDHYRGIDNPAIPADKYDQKAAGTIYTLIGYPDDVPAVNPKGHYPSVIKDSRGGYIMRSGWDDENDTVVGLWSDIGAYGRAWNQLNAGQIDILSHGAKWGYGPGPTTVGSDTSFSQILVNGVARNQSGTGLAVEHRVAQEGGYAIVDGHSKFSALGVDQALRHVMADFSPSGFSIISTFDRLRSNQVQTYAWNLFQPGKTVTLGNDPANNVDYFLSVDPNGSYLKAWFLVNGDGFITESQSTRYNYEADDIDIWVIMATGSGTPPAFSMSGAGLDAVVTLGGSVLTYNATSGRIESSTLTDLNTATNPTLSATPTRGLAPLNVAFSAAATADAGESLSHTWDFGDGTSSAAQSDSHTYTVDGIYLVSLGVDDAKGGADRVVKDIFVGNREPTARITASDTIVLPGVIVTLDAGASTDPENSTLIYSWDLGDGQILTGQTIQASWLSEITYTVELRVEDAGGLINVTRTSIQVENLAPEADFTFDLIGGFVPFTVNFDASTSFDPEGDNLLYRWDFDDGTVVETSNPLISHEFTVAKVHDVQLTVSDLAGKSKNTMRSINALGLDDIIASVEDPGNLFQGLNYQVYAGDSTDGATVSRTTIPVISSLPPLNSGRISNYDLRVTDLGNIYVLVFDGYIFIEETGAYAFRLRTQNETRILIGTQLIVGSGFPHSDTYQGLVALEAGWHPYRLESNYNVSDSYDRWNRLNITWAPPGTDTYRPIPDEILFSKVSTFQTTFDATPTTVYEGNTVMFKSTVNSPDGQPLEYLWNFGDGNTSTLPLVAHTYNLSGQDHNTFNATLTVTNSSGRAITVGEMITVSRYAGLVMKPLTSISAGKYDFDKRTTSRDITQAVNQVLEPGVELTLSSELRPDLGGAMLADGRADTRWVSSFPEDWVMFRFTDREGDDRRVNITEYAFTAGGLSWTVSRDPKDWEIYGSNNPQTFSMTPGASNDSWTLISSVADDITVLNEEGRDANNTRLLPDIYSLPNNEAYSHYLFHLRNQTDAVSGYVELTEIQLFNYFEHDPDIDNNAAPLPLLAVSSSSGEAPLTVNFDASATTDPDGDWLYYTWDFGNGVIKRMQSELSTKQHTYYTPGTYSVVLTVTDALGKTAQLTETITVSNPLPNTPPAITITASETTASVGSQIQLDASTTTDADGDAMSFHWEFGDGVSASGPVVAHTYYKAGLYDSVLIVTDERGRVNTSSTTTEVLPPNGGRAVLSFNNSDRERKIGFNRGAGFIPVGYWNNMQDRMSPAWYDSNGQPVGIQFSTTGRQTSFIGTQPIDPFDGDAIITQVNSGITAWGSDEGFTIEVDNIPYPVYDVYVYYAGSNAGIKRPVLINGIERWAWKQGYDFPGQWGVSEAASSGEAIQGANVLLWRNLQSSKVILSLLQREEGHAIAGFQIVDKTGSPDAPPIATIESPAESSWYYVGSPILLSGSAEDSEGAITDPFLEWSSSIDGVLGNGSSLSVSNLSQGTHTISLNASNNGDLQTTVSVVIDVFSEASAPVIVSHPQRGGTGSAQCFMIIYFLPIFIRLISVSPVAADQALDGRDLPHFQPLGNPLVGHQITFPQKPGDCHLPEYSLCRAS